MSFRKNTYWGTTYVTLIAAVIAIVVGLLFLLGWVFHFTLLTDDQTDWATMKVNTALMVIASGIALLLTARSHHSGFAVMLATFVGLFGLITLAEYIFRWDAHIDELFWTSPGSYLDPFPGRMSVATASLTVCIAVSLVNNRRNSKRARQITEIFAGICFMTALATLLGHLYNLQELNNSIFKSISFPTSLSFIAITTGIFFFRPDLGLLSPFYKQTAAARIGLGGMLLIFTIIFMFSWLAVQARSTGLDKAELGTALLVLLFFGSIFFLLRWRIVKLNLAEEEKERLYTIKKENEARLNEAQRIAHIGSWNLDIASSTLEWSDEIYRIFEVDPAHFKATYEAFLEAIHPDDRERVNSVYASSLQNKSPYHIEHRLLMPDGRIKFVAERCETFYDSKGQPVRSLGTVQDITELKKAESEILENEKKFRDLLESTPDAMVIVDEQGVIQMANRQASFLFGYSKEELCGQLVEVLMPEAFRDRHKENRYGYNHQPKTRIMGKSLELLAMNKEHVQFPVEISLSTIISKTGILVSAAIRDVSERKESQKALEESYQNIRLLTEHIQNIREEERTRIAREIHDELGQQLTVMMMDLSALEKMSVQFKDTASLQKLVEIRQMVSEAIRSVRRICTELRPSVLDDLGLESAMELHLKEFEKRAGIHTHFTAATPGLLLTNQEKTSLFRIFQESLTNIARHANAKNVEVKLESLPAGMVLEIRDDGIGYTKKKDNKKTLGILGMHERSAAIGGKYTISGTAGQGTVVTVFVPTDSRKLPG